jgi:tRNA U34 5-methylaminomethyl-2-thiouridine-forming methyltransferase MnmC
MWTPVLTADGSWTLRHGRLGATRHSLSGAWQQARERYARPCLLREVALDRGRVRLLDVGTGLGLNLAAALAELAGTGAVLEATTLEADEAVLRAALALEDWPREVGEAYEPIRSALRAALERRARSAASARGAGLELSLLLGDARETVELLPVGAFDAVFLDPFAPRDDPALWSGPFLAALARRLAPQALLSTYSASLAVRTALARAGLRVGRGPRVGAKAEGTLASPARDLPPLERRTARKLERRGPRPRA